MRVRIDMTLDTPLGGLVLVADHGELTGVYFPDARCVLISRPWASGPTREFEQLTRYAGAVRT